MSIINIEKYARQDTKLSKHVFVWLIIAAIMLYIGYIDYLLIHIAAELFAIVISFAVAIIVYDTYDINENHGLSFLGIAYVFVGTFKLLCIMTFIDTAFQGRQVTNQGIYFLTISKYLESLSFLLVLLLHGYYKTWSRRNYKIILYCYLAVSVLFICMSFYLDMFPFRFADGFTPTQFVNSNEMVIALIYSIVLISVIAGGRNAHRGAYYFLFAALAAKMTAQFIFWFFKSVDSYINTTAYVLNVFSFSFAYKAIVDKKVKEPFILLFRDLNSMNKELENKNCQLELMNDQLFAENMRHRQMEAALFESEGRYRQLVELMPEGIFLYDKGKVGFTNSAGLKLLGASRKSQVFGKDIKNFVMPESHDFVAGYIDEKIKTQSIEYWHEYQLVRVDGTCIDVEITTAPFVDCDELSILVIARDISERKKSEKLARDMEEQKLILEKTLELDKLKTDFFSNISHELRTPINVILSTLQLSSMYLNNDDIPNKALKMGRFNNIMQQNCRRLLRLINNLIDITKIDAGYMDVHLQNCNIISVVENIVMSVAQYVESKGISLVFDTDTEERIMACDPEKIERIILNLLSNAVKFTQSGGNITVSIAAKEEKTVISVKDTGIGIPEDKRSLIFERFRQADQSLTRNYEGSGIGLSLVKSLVEMHGGTIRLDTEYNNGCNFIVELPVILCQYENNAEESDIENGLPYSHIERIKIEFWDIYQ